MKLLHVLLALAMTVAYAGMAYVSFKENQRRTAFFNALTAILWFMSAAISFMTWKGIYL